MELALSDLMAGKFMYSGQTCTAPKRIFIHQAIYNDFLEMFVDRVKRFRVGRPEEETTDVSPVASDLAVRQIKEQLQDAVQNGARILTGGDIEANLIHPTVVRDATDQMLGMREEVFGPVAFTSCFSSTKEVLARAKNHKYALRAAVFGGEEALQAAEGLRGRDCCHPVDNYTFGTFGTVASTVMLHLRIFGHDSRFELQEVTFSLHTSSVSGQGPITSDHSMTRHYYRDRVSTYRTPKRAHGVSPPYPVR